MSKFLDLTGVNWLIDKIKKNTNDINQLKEDIKEMDLSAENIILKDEAGLFQSDNVEEALNEVFTYANNGKISISAIVGNPINQNNSFSDIANHIRNKKIEMAKTLNDKGVVASSSESLESLVNKMNDIESLNGIFELSTNWIWKTSKPSEVIANTWSVCGSIQHNEKVYCLINPASSTEKNQFWCYSMKNNTWIQLESLPSTRYGASITYDTDNDKIYVAGGASSKTNTGNSFYMYDINTNTWVSKCNLPYTRTNVGLAYYGGKIYMAGGGYKGNSSSTCYKTLSVYDIESNTWDTSLPDLPYTRRKLCLVAHNGKLYAIGGGSSTSSYNSTQYVYDIASKTWSSFGAVNATGSGCRGAVYKNKLYYMFGTSDDSSPTVSNMYAIYDLSLGQWTKQNNSTQSRGSFGLGIYDDKIFLLGGEQNSSSNFSDIKIIK